MNIFKKIINKIKSFFQRKQLGSSTMYRLEEPRDNYEVDRAIEIEKLTISEEASSDDKKVFFDMYEAYKNKKIDPNNMLITDLIKVSLMLSHEQSILNKEIENMETIVKLQENKLQKLVHQESELRNQLN